MLEPFCTHPSNREKTATRLQPGDEIVWDPRCGRIHFLRKDVPLMPNIGSLINVPVPTHEDFDFHTTAALIALSHGYLASGNGNRRLLVAA